MARISEKETKKARDLAGRKNGVSRKELASALKIKLPRAAIILDGLGLKTKADGATGGRACRTLRFYTGAVPAAKAPKKAMAKAGK